ncbi:TPA: hypothetical protein DDW35_11775 [Candidatus Sumerlaeota bacterium]|jgi:hypothetical protein|nr:hypothetical protein [Candidatus Sumerlaeota bacterium]
MHLGPITAHFISWGVCYLVNCLVLWLLLNKFSHLEEGAPFKKCMLATLLMVLSAIVTSFLSFIPVLGFLIFVVVWYKLCTAALESLFEMTTGTDLPVFIFIVVYVLLKRAVYDFLIA